MRLELAGIRTLQFDWQSALAKQTRARDIFLKAGTSSRQRAPMPNGGNAGATLPLRGISGLLPCGSVCLARGGGGTGGGNSTGCDGVCDRAGTRESRATEGFESAGSRGLLSRGRLRTAGTVPRCTAEPRRRWPASAAAERRCRSTITRAALASLYGGLGLSDRARELHATNIVAARKLKNAGVLATALNNQGVTLLTLRGARKKRRRFSGRHCRLARRCDLSEQSGKGAGSTAAVGYCGPDVDPRASPEPRDAESPSDFVREADCGHRRAEPRPVRSGSARSCRASLRKPMR